MKATTDRGISAQYLGTVALFLVGGGLIASAGYFGFIPQDTRFMMKVGVAAVSLAAWLALRRNEHLQSYRQLALAFLSIALGLLLAQYFGNIPMNLLGFSTFTVQGVAMAKFGEAVPIVLSILALHFATGGNANGLFLGAGNLKLGLIVGVIGLAAFAGIGALQASGTGVSGATVVAALPWIAIFIFSNAFMEELWFRALFLKKLEPLVGAKTTLVITSLVFAVLHINATYVFDILVFLVELMAFALLWGWLMRKTNGIWGSVLIHAGGDLLIILGFLAGAQL